MHGMGNKKTIYNNDYHKRVYDRINIVVPRGRLQDIKAYAQTHNTTLNSIVSNHLQSLLGMDDKQWKAKPTESLDIDSQDNSD